MKKSISLLLALVMLVSLIAPVSVYAGNEITVTVNFDESQSQSQSKQINLPNLGEIKSVTANTGNATYSVNGDDVTVNATGGTPSRTENITSFTEGWINQTKTQSSQTFADTITATNYKGQVLTLTKDGAPFVVSGTYIPEDVKTVSQNQTNSTDSFVSTVSYNSDGYVGSLGKNGASNYVVVSGAYTPVTTMYIPSYLSVTIDSAVERTYDDEQQRWRTTYQNHNPYNPNTLLPSVYYNSDGYKGTLYRNETILSSYVDDFGYWKMYYTKSLFYYAGDVTRPEMDTRVYGYTQNYSGTVTKPAVDTRTWGQNYKLWTVTGETQSVKNYYSYLVNVTYVLDYAIDTSIITIAPYITTPVNTDITVTASASEGTLNVQSKTFTENGSFEFIATNSAGKTNKKIVTITNIDKIAPATPVIVVDNTLPTNTNVTSAITYSADSMVKEYRVNGGAWTTYTTPIIFTTNGTIEARSQDDAGNWSTTTYSVSNIDKTAPVITIEPYTTTPINADIVVTASTNEGTLNVTNKTFTANGSFDFIATDSAGNVTTRTITITNIDKTAPTTPVIVADKTAPTNTDVAITITYSADAVVKQYIVNNGAWTTYTTPVVLTSNGTVEARSQDDAGNWSTVATYSVTNIDKTAPTVTIAPYTTTPINTDIVVTASTNEGTLNVTSKTFTANGSFEFIATDSAGNITTRTITITNIDKTTPNAPVIVLDKITPTNTDVVTTITYSADSVAKEYRVNGGTWTAYTTSITFTANGTVEARSQDDAGNWSTVANYAVTNIDKITPTTSTMSIVDSNVLTIVSGTDVGFGVQVVEYRLNNGSWTQYKGQVELVDGDYFVEARTLDIVGNYSGVTNQDYVIYKSRLADAEASVVQSEASVTQASVDFARDKVEILPFTASEKVTLTQRLDVLQAKVDNNTLILELDLMKQLLVNRQADNRLDEFTARLVEMRVEVSELTLLTSTSVTTTKINQVEKVIKAIKSLILAENSMILEDIYDAGNNAGDIGDPAVEEALRQQVVEANNVALAIKAVEKAEATKLSVDITNAWTAIKIIKTEPIKGQLIVRMNKVDYIYVKAQKTVVQAETYKTSTYINNAINQVKLIANDNPNKESMITRIEIVRLEYNTAVILKDTAKLKRDAIYYVSQAESFGTVFYNAKAQFYVDLLNGVDEVLQAELQARLDVTKELLTTASTIPHTVRMATKYVETAEIYKTAELILTAQGYINLIANDNTAKAELQSRLDAIQ